MYQLDQEATYQYLGNEKAQVMSSTTVRKKSGKSFTEKQERYFQYNSIAKLRLKHSITFNSSYEIQFYYHQIN